MHGSRADVGRCPCHSGFVRRWSRCIDPACEESALPRRQDPVHGRLYPDPTPALGVHVAGVSWSSGSPRLKVHTLLFL